MCWPEVFCKRGVLRNFTEFTGKRLRQSLFFNKVAGLSPPTLLKMRLGTSVFLWVFRSFYTFSYPKTFKRCFNVVFRLIWRCNVSQRQINVETTLCTSTLKFATLNNVKSTLSISKLIWKTLDNIETTLSFST